MCIYLIVAFLAIMIYEDKLQSDVLTNLAERSSTFEYFGLVFYLLIAAFHTPIVFFVGKECLLTMY